MSSEDVLPSYAEATSMYQTPVHILIDETINITFKEPSASSRIKSFILRKEPDTQHHIYTGVRRKSKVVAILEKVMTGKFSWPTLHSQPHTDFHLERTPKRNETAEPVESVKTSEDSFEATEEDAVIL
jgi:hypothetical protein